MKISISLAALLVSLYVWSRRSGASARTPHDRMPGKGDDAERQAHGSGSRAEGGRDLETTANLTPHLGHKVTITGVGVPRKDNVHTMKVTAVKMISATCP